MMVALASLKGSPGVTTATLALAAVWPAGRRLLIEADPAGGDLASRLVLPAGPGLMELAAAARREAGPEVVWRCARTLPGGPHVLTAPPGAEQARACVTAVAATPVLARFSGSREPVVIIDCGRMDPGGPALPLARQADLTVLVARPHVEDLAHLAPRIPDLTAAGLRLAVLLAPGPRRQRFRAAYRAREVAAALQLPVLGQLPDDETGAAVLTGRRGALRRRELLLPLPRAAVGLAAALAAGPPGHRPPTQPGTTPGRTRPQYIEVTEVTGDRTR